MEARKVIFLDFDGVIRCFGWKRESLNHLNDVIDETGARIVVTSDWRHSHSREEIVGLLDGFGILGIKNADVTPILKVDEDNLAAAEPRRSEILAWLKENGPRDYVILDDMNALASTELADRLVLCNYEEGLTELGAIEAIEILNYRKTP